MRGAGRGGGEARPARVRARPVTAVDGLLRAERLDHDRRPALPVAVLVAIVGNARRGAAAGAGEHEHTVMRRDPVSQSLNCFGHDPDRTVNRTMRYQGPATRVPEKEINLSSGTAVE